MTLRLNNNLVFKFKEFRSVVLPDTTQDTGKTFDISLVLKDSEGRNVDLSHLKISYDIKWLSLPNTPIIFENQWYPALTVYKGKLYSLPVSSGI
ncbi:hypothetical protein REIP_0019 [Rickettsia endosymbiont of Ixodes pacificus]|uniref:hypothetical protein n=1 Tax=Rickettsia endosymbiont of Ixodes pacificus TaxID=1133329 RepID=UPI00061FCB8E|nr:hypothetical protein [Rickettsia endosymbiont of Ixodes pacificus]KJW02020.1 hypothetical protein REIP_0019 [Rickettsia endosymbiont of Ixodes pacificus]